MTDNVTRSTYEAIAREFAERNRLMSPRLAAAADHFMTLLKDNGRRGRPRILDLGCGHGRDALWMTERGGVVTGFDLSFAMLRQAQATGVRSLAQMDMGRLGLAEDSVEGIWCNAALLHIAKQGAPAVLSDLRRVLIHGGILFISVKSGSTEGFEHDHYGDISQQRFFARYGQSEAAGMLAGAGWSIVEQDIVQGSTDSWLHFYATA